MWLFKQHRCFLLKLFMNSHTFENTMQQKWVKDDDQKTYHCTCLSESQDHPDVDAVYKGASHI